MPDRIIRDELLESERWLSLKDNADRLAYISLLLKADALGNFSAEPFRLMRLWRDFGINTDSLVAKTLTELTNHDLIRLYQVGEKQLLHIPRFGQRLRHVRRIFPLSPWTTEQEKQTLADNSPDARQVQDRLASAEVKGSEGKGREEKRKKSIPALSDEETAEKIPIIGGEFPISKSYAKELEGLYPSVDVPQTLREIRGWNLANPTKRKTASGILRHVNSWLAKEQNHG
jgi:hypothetical protein